MENWTREDFALDTQRDVERLANSLILPGFEGVEPPEWLDEFPGLAGVVLFGHNTPDYSTTGDLTSKLHAVDPNLLIFSDEEGGDVTRIQAAYGGSLPGARALGLFGDIPTTELCGFALGQVLCALGIDGTFAPDLDVASEPRNPVIGVRSFSGEPVSVAAHGVAFAEGLARAGILACGKHFPGHGDTQSDSHLELPSLEVSESILEQRDLFPFRAAIGAGIPMIMTGHLRFAPWGEEPVSMNPRATAWLRGRGFEGVIVTDALDMRGVSGQIGIAEASVRALQAGADLLCLGNSVHATYAGSQEFSDAEIVGTVRDAIVRALVQGRLEEARLKDSRRRVQSLRETRVEAQFSRPGEGSSRSVDELDRSLAKLDEVGAKVSSGVIRSRGNVCLRPGDILLDARSIREHAAGAVAPTLVRVLEGQLGVSVATRDAGGGVPGLGQGKRLVLLTRNAEPEAQDLVARFPDCVVIHAGEPDAAPDAANVVYSLGVARANAEAVVALCKE